MELNKVTIIGNVTGVPRARRLSSGQRVVSFSLATVHVWKDAKTKAKNESVEFHDVVAWGKLADIIVQYVKKSSKVYIEGRLNTRRWQTKDRELRTSTEIVASNLILLGHRAEPKQ